MAERKALRDVLEDVLTRVVDDNIPGFDGLSELIHRSGPVREKPSAKTDSPTAGTVLSDSARQAQTGKAPQPAASIQPPQPAKTPRKKATHLLSEQNLDGLGSARSKIARMLEDKLGERPSRSDIVDKALEIVLEEFDEKGLDSTLVQKILSLSNK